jgi:site-specific DNA-methyltransferase (adenine-specific)
MTTTDTQDVMPPVTPATEKRGVFACSDLFSLRPYYEDQWVKIYNADSYKVNLPACDLMLTDPPYELCATGGGIGAKRKYLADIAGKIDEGFDMEMLAAFPNWVVFCGKQQLQRLLAATGERRWTLVTWNKTNPTPLVNANYLPDTEYIVHAYQSGRLFGEYRDRSRFIVHPVEQNGFDHPTVKPLAVVSKMVRLGSQPGETILDPFCGTGTTLLAAKLCGRRAIGIEREEKHCETAANRCAQDCLALGG